MFPEAISLRKEIVESEPNYQNVIDKFEAFGQKRTTQRQRGNQGQPPRWIVITKSVAVVAGIIGILLVRFTF